MVVSILDHMDPHGFVKASYWQLGAESGRMSCSDPNNQQIPRDKDFRECVQAPDGWLLVDADFGQMELRLAAAVAKDERMTAAFQAGEDLHTGRCRDGDMGAQKSDCGIRPIVHRVSARHHSEGKRITAEYKQLPDRQSHRRHPRPQRQGELSGGGCVPGAWRPDHAAGPLRFSQGCSGT